MVRKQPSPFMGEGTECRGVVNRVRVQFRVFKRGETPLFFSPPLKQKKKQFYILILLERGIKGGEYCYKIVLFPEATLSFYGRGTIISRLDN